MSGGESKMLFHINSICPCNYLLWGPFVYSDVIYSAPPFYLPDAINGLRPNVKLSSPFHLLSVLTNSFNGAALLPSTENEAWERIQRIVIFTSVGSVRTAPSSRVQITFDGWWDLLHSIYATKCFGDQVFRKFHFDWKNLSCGFLLFF